MPINKVTVASSVVAAVVVAGVAIGYGVSVSALNTVNARVEQSISNYLNYDLPKGETPYSVKLADVDSDLFDRNLSLVVTQGENILKLPLQASVGFLSLSYKPDFVNMQINDENAIKYLGFDSLVSLESQANYKVVAGDFTFTTKATYLNDKNLMQPTKAPANLDCKDSKCLGINEAAIKRMRQTTSFNDVGTLDFSMSIDEDENIKTSVSIDSLVERGLAISRFKAYSHSKGLAELKGLGKTEFALDKFVVFDNYDYSVYTEADDFLFKSDVLQTKPNGNMDISYDLKIAKANDLKDVNFVGTIKDLNLANIKQLNKIPVSGFYELINFISNYPFTFEMDKGSSFKYGVTYQEDKYSKEQTKDAIFNLETKLTIGGIEQENKQDLEALKQKNKFKPFATALALNDTRIKGVFKIDSNVDLTKVKNDNLIEDSLYLFECTKGKCSSQVDFDIPFFSGDSKVLVNGKVLP